MNKRTIMFGILALCILGSLTGCSRKNIEYIEISIPDYQKEYDINTDIPITISVTPEDADSDGLEYESDSYYIDFSEKGINTGKHEGTYEVYVKADDIQSNALSITVVDFTARAEVEAAEEQRLAEEKAAREAEEKRLAEEKAAKEAEEKRLAEEQAAKEAEEKRLAEEAERQSQAEQHAEQARVEQNNGISFNGGGGNAANDTPASSSGGGSGEVWIPRTGSKYHNKNSCSNMKNPSSVSLEYAQSHGYEPCKKCY